MIFSGDSKEIKVLAESDFSYDSNPDRLLESYANLLEQHAQQKEQLEYERYRATHDGLTGLLNDQGLSDHLEDHDAANKAIFFIDGDNFGQINKHFGHEVGDQTIQVVAEALTASVRADDIVARIGGDEFIIIADKTVRSDHSQMPIGADDINIIATRIHANIDKILEEQPKLADTSFGVSIGSTIGSPGMTFAELRIEADKKMRRAKELKKSALGSAALRHL